MPHFVLNYVLHADYLDRHGPFKDGHMRHLLEAAQHSGLVIAGAFGSPPAGAVYVFDSAGAAEAFAHADPYVAGGVATQWSIAPWYPVVGPGAA